MTYSPGDWIELVRDVDGGLAGMRGKVTSTGFLGGLDIELTTGARLVGVDPAHVKAAPPPSSSTGDGGCGLAVAGLAAGAASLAAAVVTAWTRARWGA